MEKKKSIKLNYIYNVSYQLLILITPLITTPYISHVLRADLIGDYSFTASIVSYFTMFAVLGTLTYGNREISYQQDDRKKRSTVFWEIEILSILTTFLCTVLYLFFLLLSPDAYTKLYAIQILSVIYVAFDITWLLQGMEEFGKITLRNIFFKLIQIALIFFLVKNDSDLFLYIGCMVIIPLISNLSLWFYLPQFVDKPDLKNLHPLLHLKPTIALFIPTVAISIYTVFDKTMIGFFSNNYENGYYEQATKLSKTTLMLVTSLGAVTIPRIGYYFNQKKQEKVHELIYKSYNFVWFLSFPLSFGIIGIANNIVPWFYGPGYEKIKLLLPLLGILVIIIGISNVTGIQYFVPTKREKYLTQTVIAGAIVNIICNLILIPRFFSIGAALASIIAETVITALQLYLVRKELCIPLIFKQSVKYLIAAFVMLILLFVEDRYLTPSFIHSAIMVCSGCITYFLLLLILRDCFFFQMLQYVITKFRTLVSR